jgi:cytochrome P450
MSNPFDDHDGMYLVVVDDEDHHSLWPALADVPAGWRMAHDGTRASCLDYIERNWTDMRPRRLRPDPYPFAEYQRLDLHPRYAQLREQRTLLRVRVPYGDDAWLATRYCDVKTVLGDPRFSRAAAAEHDEARLTPFPIRTSILGTDPPEQTRLRQLLAKAFTMRRVELLRPYIRQVATDLVDGLVRHGPPADLVEDFAAPMAALVICELMGIPAEEQKEFRRWTGAFSSTTAMTTDDVEDQMDSMYDYVTDMIDRHRRTPDEGLVSGLIHARDVEDLLSGNELLELVTVLIIAGYDTTYSELMSAVYLLLTHPEQTEELRARPELMPTAVEELLRFIPIDSHVAFARYATADVELSGTVVRAGEAVLASLPSANRDAEVFTDPDRLDFHRERNPHVGFGHGLHHCVGAALARIELKEVISALLSRFSTLRLAVPVAEVRWKSGVLVRSLVSLPAQW